MNERNVIDIIERFQTHHALQEESKMNNSHVRTNGAGDSGWDVSFWFAVLSPVFGILAGLLAAFLIYH